MDNELKDLFYVMEIVAPILTSLPPIEFKTIMCSLFDAYEDVHPDEIAVEVSRLIADLVKEAHETNFSFTA